MAKYLICDKCKKPTAKIALRLYLVPMENNPNNPALSRSIDHNDYSGYSDIGDCCAAGIVRDFTFQLRRRR